MTAGDQTLFRHLAVVLIIKLLLLFGLWWGFVRDQQVPVDAQGMATQALLLGSMSTEGDNK